MNLQRPIVPAIVLILASALAVTSAQPLPAMLYGDSLNERAQALVEATGGPGYCMAGWTTSYGPPGVDNVLIVRTDPLGLPIWSRVSVGESNEQVWSMCRTHDSGYALTGWTESYGLAAPGRSIFILKLDAAGNQLWGRVYSGGIGDEAFSIVETMDGGFAVAGFTASYGPPPHPNILVMKTDGAGVPQWTGVYYGVPEQGEDEAYGIVQLPDSSFTVVGRMQTPPSPSFQAFVLGIAKNGPPLWLVVTPGEQDDDEAHAVAVDQQGIVFVGGWTRSFGSSPGVAKDMLLSAFGQGGMPFWARTYGWPANDEEIINDRAVIPTLGRDWAYCGPTKSVGPGSPRQNFIVGTVNPLGNPVWTFSHPSAAQPGMQDDVPMAMVQVPYGRNYAITGWSNSFPFLGGGDDFHLLTVDSMGRRPVCVEPQEPVVDSFDWMPWEMGFDPTMPEMDSMPLAPIEVRFHPICEETTAVREGRVPMHRPVETGFALQVQAGRVQLVVTRAADIRVQAFNADGRLVARVADRRFLPGRHDLAVPKGTGVVMLRAESGGVSVVAKHVGF